MTARIFTATTLGFDGKVIEVECDTSNGLPTLLIVGLGNKSIDEAKERVRSAIKNSKLEFPKKRITINLAPASLPKDGTQFDLAIAVALLAVSGQVPKEKLAKTLFVGELALDGAVRPIRGIIAHAEAALKAGFNAIAVPETNANQAALVEGITVLPVKSLKQLCLHLLGQEVIPPYVGELFAQSQRKYAVTLDDIQGQEQAKRALVIAAAGGHNLLLHGPPGAGKTMLAKSLISILPELSASEIVEVTKLYSLATHDYDKIITHRPFRTPHHSASHIALVGGGTIPRPGEISLAHHGILFLDEIPEFSRQALESLRQPLEDKKITVARVNERSVFPASFMLIATQNPCPCGYLGDQKHACECSLNQIQAYKKKISGPLLDRIDMILEVSRVEPHQLLAHKQTFLVDNYRKAVTAARKMQFARFNDSRVTNAHISSRDISKFAGLSPTAKALMDQAATKLNLSARSYFKIIKVARTIADLEKSDKIELGHVSEALQFRYRASEY